MFDSVRTFIREHAMGEVPDEMSACLDCNVVQCSIGKYETCLYRREHAAALKAIRTGQNSPEGPG